MFLDSTISRQLNDTIDRELEHDEKVMFVETPQPRFFTATSTGAFLFAIPWTLFALFWIAGASGSKVPDFKNGFDLFPLFGIPFVLIGFAMLSSPIWAYRNASKTAYVITDRRAISIVGGYRTTIRSYFPKDLGDLYRTERSDGSGDVIIGLKTQRDSDGDHQRTPYGFLGVENAKATEDRLRKLASANTSPTTDQG